MCTKEHIDIGNIGMHQYFTRVFSVSTYFESGRDTMKGNTIALKFYNIAVDASLIDRWDKKNIVSR